MCLCVSKKNDLFIINRYLADLSTTIKLFKQMKILIVEDEQKTASLLKELIELHPNYTVVAMCDSVETAVNYLRIHQHNLDVVFMDIQLSDGQSFEIFDKIAINLPVVFCTSYDEYTLKAFNNNGIGYILKPFNDKDIHQAIHKVEGLKGSFVKQSFAHLNLKELVVKEKTYQTSFLIRFREKIYPVLVSDIAFIYLENEAAYLYNFKGEKHPVFKTLDEIEKSVPPQQFYRVNRQMIVNRKAVKEIETYFNQRITVHLTISTPEKIIVPRPTVSPFLTWIEKG
jgi:two-component system, LytTR family, response regulator LytT